MMTYNFNQTIPLQIPRKFRFQTGIRDEDQLIWMEDRTRETNRQALLRTEEADSDRMSMEKDIQIDKRVLKGNKFKESRLVPKFTNLKGLRGKLILARRKTPRPKFFAS